MNNALIQQLLMYTKYTMYVFLFQVITMNLLFASHGKAQEALSVKEVRLTIQFSNEDIINVFKEIESSTEFTFAYNASDLKSIRRVSGKYSNQSLYEILIDIARQTGMRFKQVNHNINVAETNLEEKEEVEIVPTVRVTGKVTSLADNTNLPGVNVLVKGTNIGTVTDVDGNYGINVPNESDTLVFSSIGYTTEEVPVRGQTVIDVSLAEDIQSLSEVVVIGYGTQKKADLTGSVALVNTDEMNKIATNDITKALQGRVAGVSVQSGGEPGAAPVVKIRGISSFNNNVPLYIVDGVVTPINDLPMSDVESIQVLKDASAAAIYGSRASNGVVIITTKRGEEGPLQINYTGYYGLQHIPTRYDVANREEYQLLVNEASINAGVPIKPANDPSSPYFVDDIDTDWQEEVMKTGKIQEHNLSLSGGNQTSTYNFSLNYFDQSGTVEGNGPTYTRYGIGINSDHNFGKLKVGESIHYTYADQNFMTFMHTGNNMTYMVNAIPTLPVYSDSTRDGYSSADQVIHGSYTANVIGMNSLLESNTKRFRFIGNVYGEYEFIPALKYRLSLSFERTDWRDFYFEPIHDLGWFYVNNIAKMNDWRGNGYTGTLEQTLTYDKTLGKHKVTAMVGNTILGSGLNRIYGHAEGFTEPYFKVLSQGTSGISVTGDQFENRLLSYFGRLIYSFNDTYLLTATFRRDGSSRFAEDYRWGNFPSIALGWKIQNEAFMQSVPFISEMKLRASYGRLGNQEIPDYAFAATINPYAHYVFNGQLAQGASQYVFATPDIRWESKESTNVGIDFGFLDDRINFTAEYYVNTSSDMLVRVPIPGSTGSYPGESPLINGASVRNKGFEFTLGYSKAGGPFTYNFNANLSTLDNEVLSLGYGDNPIYGAMSRTAVGSEVGEFYGWIIDGIFQNQTEIDALNEASPIDRYQEIDTSPGDYRFKDINGRNAEGDLTGQPDGMINDDDRTYLGSAIPNLYFGLNFSGSYKNFDLTVSANGVSGNKINNAIRGAIENGAGWDNYSKNMLNRWTENNRNTDVPRVVIADPNHNARASVRWLEDGSYLKLTNIELGYNFASSLLSSLNLSSLRVYLSGQNVYTFTKYTGFDPDFGNEGLFDRGTDHGSYPNRPFNAYSGGLPNPRTILLGVKVGI